MPASPENHEDYLPPDLQRRLERIYQSPIRVPPELDEAILRAAHKRFANVRRFRSLLRWAIPAAAAAAAIVIAVWQPWQVVHRQATPIIAARRESAPAAQKYTILDAYRVARQLQQGRKPDARWDLNGDGTVDRMDVDLIASEAVRLQ